MSVYKFEGFNVGDVIRAQDFEDRPGRGECSITGEVIAVRRAGSDAFGFAHYLVKCTSEKWDGEDYTVKGCRAGHELAVPMETSDDWDGRVAKVTG